VCIGGVSVGFIAFYLLRQLQLALFMKDVKTSMFSPAKDTTTRF